MTEQLDRRKKAYKDIIGMMPEADSHIKETLDGHEFKYLPEPRCRVCTAGDISKGLPNGNQVQGLVDTLLLYPKSVADIHRTIDPMMANWPPKAKITYKSIRTHQNKHLAWDRLALRMMVERWAQEKGIPVLDSAGRMILTHEAFLEATAQIGWQRLMEGQMEPSWSETEKAWETMGEIQKMAEGEFTPASLLSELNTIIEVIREEIPPERWPYVVDKIEAKKKGQDSLPPMVEQEDDEFQEIIEEQHKLMGEDE